MSKKTIVYLFFTLLAFISTTSWLDARCHMRCRPRRVVGWRFNQRVHPYIGFNYTPRYYDYPYYHTYPYYSWGFGIGMPRYGYPVGFW